MHQQPKVGRTGIKQACSLCRRQIRDAGQIHVPEGFNLLPGAVTGDLVVLVGEIECSSRMLKILFAVALRFRCLSGSSLSVAARLFSHRRRRSAVRRGMGILPSLDFHATGFA